ncbi:CRAL-TRIO domain-containing protein [Mycena galopus ATCC 62051]|nr:CRAL-TRIO domain-containing protein [Mycena galopus ATCC 62051]
MTTDAQTKSAAGNYTPPPGHLGNLTPEQEAALAKISEELRAEGAFVEARHDDATLLRFLRARKFDVPKAKEMVIASEKWRKEFGVDELVKTFDFTEVAEVDKYLPQYYHSGRPIYIQSMGKLDVKAMYECTTQERLLQHLVVEYETFLNSRLGACSTAVGHPVETSLSILDLGGVSLSSFVRVKDYVSAATHIGQNYYPECMGAFYVVNAPMGFSTVWHAVKPWIDEVTVGKIHILGGPKEYAPELLAQIDEGCLPKEFGGACQCAGGCSLSDVGPWNPVK